jgi:hypothetical protein
MHGACWRGLVHYSDGGSGMRYSDGPLELGAELRDGGHRYRVVRVEQPPGGHALGHAWAERATSE